MTGLLTKEDVREIINETVNATIARLKTAGMLKDDRRSVTDKLEELLRNYPTFKTIHDREDTVKTVEMIEAALRTIEDDPYYDVIPMFYFDRATRESIALDFETSVTTISRNKARLLGKLAPLLFSDDVIYDLFL